MYSLVFFQQLDIGFSIAGILSLITLIVDISYIPTMETYNIWINQNVIRHLLIYGV